MRSFQLAMEGREQWITSDDLCLLSPWICVLQVCFPGGTKFELHIFINSLSLMRLLHLTFPTPVTWLVSVLQACHWRVRVSVLQVDCHFYRWVYMTHFLNVSPHIGAMLIKWWEPVSMPQHHPYSTKMSSFVWFQSLGVKWEAVWKPDSCIISSTCFQ